MGDPMEDPIEAMEDPRKEKKQPTSDIAWPAIYSNIDPDLPDIEVITVTNSPLRKIVIYTIVGEIDVQTMHLSTFQELVDLPDGQRVWRYRKTETSKRLCHCGCSLLTHIVEKSDEDFKFQLDCEICGKRCMERV